MSQAELACQGFLCRACKLCTQLFLHSPTSACPASHLPFKLQIPVSTIHVTCGSVQGVGLCHGIAGNGYSFLTLFRATKDPTDLNRAQLFAQLAAEKWQKLYSVPDSPASLFEVRWGLMRLFS